jgi:putative nucleotidyltransferase with HDIG domain
VRDGDALPVSKPQNPCQNQRVLSEETRVLSKPASLVGQVVGGYRLVTALRSGGMGTVYYAEHTVIGRRAAVKVLHPEVSRNPQLVSRFLTEARAANDIRHPNVVEITDLGQSGDVHYIVMSFLEGETLGERLEREKVLDESTTVRIVRQIASALAAAHDHGIVHRDLKPENIFLLNHPDYPDYVKVLDFGIAKLIGPQQASAPHNTVLGMVIGTPAYMSPEQCRGQAELDHRSDIYSLGIMLYEMLTGTVPFRRNSTPDVLLAHVHDMPVPPLELNPKLSMHISDAIMRALDKDPALRFASMRELRDAIENVVRPAKATAATSIEEETFEKREKREAAFVVSKLTDIILKRLDSDNLLVPAMPAIAVQCMRLLEDPNQTFKKVGELVGKDPLLASRVLRLANSAAFPGKTPANTLEQAIPRMGTEGLKLALVHYSMYQAFSSRDARIQSAFRGIWEHSLAVALVAKEIAGNIDGNGAVDAGVAYLAGLLHDVGKPVVAALLLEAEKLASVHKSAVPWISHKVWSQVVDRSHRNIGVALSRRWQLPDEISSAVERCAAYDAAIPRTYSNIVCLANAFAKQQGLYAGDVDAKRVGEVVAEGKRLLGLSDEAMSLLCKDLYSRVGTLFEIKVGKPKSEPS